MTLSIFGAGELAAAFIPTAANDIIGIYDQDFVQLFPQARPLKVSPSPTSKLMEQPLETNGVTSDHKVIQPVEIQFNLIVPAFASTDVYNQIYTYFKNSHFMNVQTKARLYTNQVITDMPHEESADAFDVLILALKCREVKIVKPKYKISPKRARHRSTVDKGTVNGNNSSQDQSVLDQLYGHLVRK